MIRLRSAPVRRLFEGRPETLLPLFEFPLHALSVGDVPVHAGIAVNFTPLVAYDGDGHLGVNGGAVLPAGDEFPSKAPLLVEFAGGLGFLLVGEVYRDDVPHVPHDRPLRFPDVHFFGGFVLCGDPAFRVRGDDRVEHAFEEPGVEGASLPCVSAR